ASARQMSYRVMADRCSLRYRVPYAVSSGVLDPDVMNIVVRYRIVGYGGPSARSPHIEIADLNSVAGNIRKLVSNNQIRFAAVVKSQPGSAHPFESIAFQYNMMGGNKPYGRANLYISAWTFHFIVARLGKP